MSVPRLGACPDSVRCSGDMEVSAGLDMDLAGSAASGGGEFGGGQTPPLSELEHVVGEADEAPFAGDVVEPAHQELTEAASLLDLPEHRLGQLLAQAIRGFVSAGLDLLTHGGDARASALSVSRVLGAT